MNNQDKMDTYERLRICFGQRTFFLLVIIMSTVYLVNLNFTTYTFDYNWDVSYWSHVINRTGVHRFLTAVNKGFNNLPDCPAIPPGLQGRVVVKNNTAEWTHIENDVKNITPGGRYKPPNCTARHRVAIVIPYRDREKNLKAFLRHLHPFLQRQQIDYGIYVVEMTHEQLFNRGILMNIGFVEAMKQYDYQCFIFHDVDLLPEDDRNLYTCPIVPRHMSTAVSNMNYTWVARYIHTVNQRVILTRLPYPFIFGGVAAIPTNQFRLINGYSNFYFGWGGEDDDFYARIINSNLIPIRYSGQFARYKMLTHGKQPSNNQRYELLKKTKQRQYIDGLSSLKYTLISLQRKPLFTWIYVSLNMNELTKSMATLVKSTAQLPNIENTEKQKITDFLMQNNILLNFAKGKKKPVYVNWIPTGYKGEIPVHLSKF